jgi:hypothetical protein
LPKGWRELSLPEKIGVLGGIIAIAGGLISVLAFFGIRGLGGDEQKAKKSDLKVLDVVVTTESFGGVPGTNIEKLYQQAALRLHNTGNQRSVLTRALFTVRAVGVIKSCGGLGGGLEVSESYDVQIPRTATPGDEIQEVISQQLGPDEADHFTFSFTTDLEPAEERPAIYLFQLDVAIEHDASKELRVGKIIISVPANPSKFDLWTKDDATRFPNGNPSSDEDECRQQNNKELRGILNLPGTANPQVESLLDEI